MVFEVKMPKLGAIMTEGTVSEWLKTEGSVVRKGDPLLLVETEKVSVEVPSDYDGVLLKVMVPSGSEAPVGAVIGYIGEEGEEFQEAEAVPQETAPGPSRPGPQPEMGRGIRASPAARKLARDRGIDLREVAGTGPRGSIVARDVEGFVKAGEPEEVLPLVGRRKAIAERMVRSYTSAPHVTLHVEVDMSGALAETERLEREGVKATITVIIVKAVAEALRSHKLVNSTLEGGEVKLRKTISVGIATDTEEGLIVPVVHETDKKDLPALCKESTELFAKARAGTLSVDEVSGGTFTVSNLGMLGVDSFTPIINPPQAAILGIGRIRRRPFVRGGILKEAPEATFSLSFDHRILDGAQAARFLSDLKESVEKLGS